MDVLLDGHGEGSSWHEMTFYDVYKKREKSGEDMKDWRGVGGGVK